MSGQTSSAKVGRPSKYNSAYCAEVINHMAEGASITSFAAEIGVARSTINQWMEDYPEFSEAVTRAKAKAQAWWEKAARHLAVTGQGNATICVFSLKNLGSDDFKDKTEQDINLKTDLADVLAQRRAKAAALNG